MPDFENGAIAEQEEAGSRDQDALRERPASEEAELASLKRERETLLAALGRLVERDRLRRAKLEAAAKRRASLGAAARELVARFNALGQEHDDLLTLYRAIVRSPSWRALSAAGLAGATSLRRAKRDIERRRAGGDGLFDLDPDWYLAQYPDVVADGGSAAEHWELYGRTEGRFPNARAALAANALDPGFYLTEHPDVLAAGHDPLTHYVRHGRDEGRPSRPEASEADIEDGAFPDLVPSDSDPVSRARSRFDEDWYRQAYADVAEQGLDPWRHYLRHGRHEGRHPNAEAALLKFDPAWYYGQYPDVVADGADAFEHYVAYGRPEGRHPNAGAALAASVSFDAEWYAREYQDVVAAGLDPWYHFQHYGSREGRFGSLRHKESQIPFELADFCDPSRDEDGPRHSDPDILVSVVTPSYDTEPSLLRELHQSLRNQLYETWEWVVVDDGSSRAATVATLKEIAARDPRVKVTLRPDNQGIAAATNAAIAAASGRYVALVDHDDLLPRKALLHVYRAILARPDADLVYTDEFKLTPNGRLDQFWAKPDWSPSYLENTMCLGHLSVYRTSFLRDLGGLRSEYDGTQDFDLALRASLRDPVVVHVPEFCYVWRIIPGSSAGSLDEKHYAVERQGRAVLDYARQINPDAKVVPGWGAGYWRIEYPLPDPAPLVSYVIPTAGRRRTIRGRSQDLLLNCIGSFETASFYPNREYVVVHNGDLGPEQIAELGAIAGVRLVHYAEDVFNLSRKINLGVREAAGEIVCLLNDDVEAISPQGGRDLVSYLLNTPDVGAIGPLCLFEDGTIQQNGVVLLETIGPVHAGAGEARNFGGHQAMLRCRREAFCIGGAIMFIRKELYQACGGFTEDLPLNYNDVDLCLRLRRDGYRVVVDPSIEVFHLEGASKEGTCPVEQERLFVRNGQIADPYFNSWFDPGNPNYRLNLHQDRVAALPFGPWLDRRIARRAEFRPAGRRKLSVCVPVYNQPRRFLEEMYTSVLMQTYGHWELLIYDDASTEPETREWLGRLRQDDRVRLIRSETNLGIAGANRNLLAAATGDFMLPLDADDFLAADALQVMARAIEQNPTRKVFYSDEYKSNPSSIRFSPFFKPDFDPVLLTNCCYPTHLMAIEVGFQRRIGSYTDDRATWCHDYDTLTRALAAGEEPVHVREPLYAWRINPGSTASAETGTKPGTVASQRFVLERLLEARGLTGSLRIEPNCLETSSGMWRLRATRPVEGVVVLAARDVWRPGGVGLDGLARAAGEPNAAWVAILLDPEDDEALLELSAPAAFEPRIAAVSGLLVADESRTVAWSGGVFLPGGQVFDPYAGQVVASGGYHAQLWCQRCVDLAAPVNVLVRADALSRAVGGLDPGADADALMTALGLRAHESGELIAVTPHLRAAMPPSLAVPLPLDRAGRLPRSPSVAAGSRWYDGRLETKRPHQMPGLA